MRSVAVALALFLAGILMAQAPQSDVGKILGSGRNDLWVFGVDQDANDHSVLVQLRSWKVPPESWGATAAVSAPSATLYSERPKDWEWSNRPARQLRGDFYYHLSKYDDRSAFANDWGMSKREDWTYSSEGAVLRYEDGHLKLIAEGLKQARLDYGLAETQNFLGMIGNKVFYYEPALSDRVFFFEKGHLEQTFEVVVPTRPLWARSWKLTQVEQVFDGNNPEEILVYAWAKNSAWISAKQRRDSSGIVLDLKTAKPIVRLIK